MDRKTVLAGLSLALLYYFFGKLSFILLHAYGIVSIGLFASEGIALAFALFFGKRVVWGIFLGQFVLAYGEGVSLLNSVGIATVNSLEALVAITLAKRFKIDLKLDSFHDIFTLFAMIPLLQLVSAGGSHLLFYFTGYVSLSHLFSSAFSWWFGNVMGQILFAPFVLLLLGSWSRFNSLGICCMGHYSRCIVSFWRGVSPMRCCYLHYCFPF
jgi:integral membrane sensor domain MASE1